MKAGKIQPQMTQMNADSDCRKIHLRPSAKSAVKHGLEGDAGEERDMSLQLQQTEIGKFPSAWVVARVDSAFDIQQGKQVSRRNRDGEHQRPFLRTKNVFWNRLELTDLDEMHFSEAEQTRLELRANDMLVCEGGADDRR